MQESYKTLLRLIDVLNLLKDSRQPKSAKDILEYLLRHEHKVELLTVQRDLKMLSDHYKEIEVTKQGNANLYSFAVKGSGLLPMLNPAEVTAFILVNDLLSEQLPKSILDQLDNYFKASEEHIKKSYSAKKLLAWKNKIRVIPANQRLEKPEIDPHIQAVIFEALYEGKCFKARYNEYEKDYVLTPLGLIQRGASTYLVAVNADDINKKKLFALHRFESVETDIADQPIECEFNIDDYIQSGAVDFTNDTKPANIELKFDESAAYHLYETPLTKNQKLKEIGDNKVILKAKLLISPQLKWWILGFGNQVEVIAPKSLRDEMVTISAGMAALYK